MFIRKIYKISIISLFAVFFIFANLQAKNTEIKTVWLDELGADYISAGWGTPHANKSVEGNPLTIAGKVYNRGIGTHAESYCRIKLDGKAAKFSAFVGIDDEINGATEASVVFIVNALDKDKNTYELWNSGIMRAGEQAKEVNVDINDYFYIELIVTDGGNGINYDHADWAMAKLEYYGERPEPAKPYISEPYILTPKAKLTPKINGPKVIGARVGSPFLFTIPVTGKRPIMYSVSGLPDGLKLDKKNGRIVGIAEKRGIYNVKITVRNILGKDSENISIEVGDEIALTPPMGWNSWNSWGCSVSDEKVRASAKAMVDKGLINYGWAYINIDDCWQGSRDPETGEIRSNEKFPDMKGLADYVHNLGLKIGLYTDCGPKTCAGFEGSENHENQDISTYAKWGFDYVKIDWCYCEGKDPRSTYKVFGDAIGNAPRDIVFSICDWGVDEPWLWGAEVGGNSWRTTGDINDSWTSMANIGFNQADLYKYAFPGHWNDPDMLVVGKVGWGDNLRQTKLTPDEQYTHISLWCLLAAPLLIGCPIDQIDDFTFSLLTNNEVLAVNQDPLGHQAKRIVNEKEYQIWTKDLEDGSLAVGLFNMDAYDPKNISLEWSKLGISGEYVVRDLWRQKDLGVYNNYFKTNVLPHGVVLIRLIKNKNI